MAKRQQKRDREVEEVEQAEAAGARVTLADLGAAMRRQVEALRRPIVDLANKFAVVRASVKDDLGPKVMQLFNTIKAEHATFSFVEFVRMFAPDLPTNAAERNGVQGYRTHKVYYTLDYMRRQMTQRPRGRAGVRDSAVDSFARSIATILQVVPDASVVWKAIQTEFNFNARVLGRLQKRVEATKPLFSINLPPRAHVKVGNVIHMEREQADAGGEQAEQAGANLGARGRKVKRVA